MEPDQDLRRGLGQALAGTNIERHPLPSPGIDLETHGGEGFHFRVWRHAFFRAVTTELPAHDVTFNQGRNRLQHLDLLIADGLTVRADGRLHGEVGQNLKQVIFDDVTDGSGPIVKRAAALHPELLRHGYLHAFDMEAIPKRLQEGIGKMEIDDVVYGPLAEVMVDAEDRGLGKSAEQNPVQLPRRGQVRSERLLDNHAGVGGTARLAELLDNGTEEHRRNGEIMRRPLRGAEL